jgi:hypothetical protein
VNEDEISPILTRLTGLVDPELRVAEYKHLVSVRTCPGTDGVQSIWDARLESLASRYIARNPRALNSSQTTSADKKSTLCLRFRIAVPLEQKIH